MRLSLSAQEHLWNREIKPYADQGWSDQRTLGETELSAQGMASPSLVIDETCGVVIEARVPSGNQPSQGWSSTERYVTE